MAAIASSDPNGELKFAARGGLGAVMGSKGIKAMVVDKTLQQPVYQDRQKFMDMVRMIHAEFINDPKIKKVNQKTGTATIVKAVNAMGALPTCNFRQGAIDGVDGISGETMYDTIISRGGEGKTGVSCMDGCLIKCSNIYPDASGKKICSTLQYENIALLGSNLGFTNLDPVAKLELRMRRHRGRCNRSQGGARCGNRHGYERLGRPGWMHGIDATDPQQYPAREDPRPWRPSDG